MDFSSYYSYPDNNVNIKKNTWNWEKIIAIQIRTCTQILSLRKVRRHQRDNQKPQTEEQKMTKEKGQKNKQRSTKHHIEN